MSLPNLEKLNKIYDVLPVLGLVSAFWIKVNSDFVNSYTSCAPAPPNDDGTTQSPAKRVKRLGQQQGDKQHVEVGFLGKEAKDRIRQFISDYASVQCKEANGSRMVPPDCGLNTGMETWPRNSTTTTVSKAHVEEKDTAGSGVYPACLHILSPPFQLYS